MTVPGKRTRSHLSYSKAKLGLEWHGEGKEAQRRLGLPKVTELESKLRSINSTPTPSLLRSCFKCECLLPFHASKTHFPAFLQRGGGELQVRNASDCSLCLLLLWSTCHPLNSFQQAWGFLEQSNPRPGGASAEAPVPLPRMHCHEACTKPSK